jgi:DNA invertase Pin-like site-specific DNA recombinase
MPQLPQADLWSTFRPQTQRHLVNVWTELLGRYLQAQRGLPRGGRDEPHDPNPAAARSENSPRVRKAIPPKQILHNQASLRRQYQLVETAVQLGWSQERTCVIDDDVGLSGTSSSVRYGLQRLVAAISLGEPGIVLVTEVSRLSRLDSDWHRFIELCAVFGTLIADEDGLYDPSDPNDRLVLGLKGTLFSAELHIIRARMRSGLQNNARRGALAQRLPVGWRGLADGSVVQDPDEQVRITLQTLFDQFGVLQTARGVQRHFFAHQLRIPRLEETSLQDGKVIWVRPTYQNWL